MYTASKIYKDVSKEEAQTIISHHFPGAKIVEYTPVGGGLFNTTYKVVTDKLSQALVLRVGPVNRELLLPYERHLMDAEAHVNQLLTEAGIPTPKLVACDTTKTVIDRDYMITEYMDSVALCDGSVPEECRDALYEESGRIMRKFHERKGERFGRIGDFYDGKVYDSWPEFLLAHIAEIGQLCIERDVFEHEFIGKVLDMYSRCVPLFEDIVEPRLTHADIWAGNILVKKFDDTWHVTAIIDADRAVYGDIDFELGSPWIMGDPFFRGYGPVPDSPDRRKRMKLYCLMYNLIDTYVWRVEYCNDHEYSVNRQRAYDTLQWLYENV